MQTFYLEWFQSSEDVVNIGNICCGGCSGALWTAQCIYIYILLSEGRKWLTNRTPVWSGPQFCLGNKEVYCYVVHCTFLGLLRDSKFVLLLFVCLFVCVCVCVCVCLKVCMWRHWLVSNNFVSVVPLLHLRTIAITSSFTTCYWVVLPQFMESLWRVFVFICVLFFVLFFERDKGSSNSFLKLCMCVRM